jgi:hypothetical protein
VCTELDVRSEDGLLAVGLYVFELAELRQCSEDWVAEERCGATKGLERYLQGSEC